MNTHIRGTFTQRHAPTQTHTHTHMITTVSTVNQMSALSVNIGLSSGAYYLFSDMVVSFIIQHTMIICVTNIKCEVCNVYLHWYQVWWQLLIPVKAGILFYRYSKYWQQPAGIESKLSVSSWQWWDLFFCLLGQYLPQSFYHSAWANLTSRLLYSECGQWSAGHSLNPPTKSKFSQHFLHQHEFWCQWNFPSIDGKTKTARTFSCTLLLSDLQYTCASFF